MAIREYTLPTFDLGNARYEQPIKVDMESFFAFSFDISERLLDLEASHLSPTPLDDELLSLAAAQAQWM